MNSTVVQSLSGHVTFTLLELGEIQRVVKLSILSIAMGAQEYSMSLFSQVASCLLLMSCNKQGILFLRTPRIYYDMLPERFEVAVHNMDILRALNILADQDTESTHVRRTLFFELIERCKVRKFSSGNIKALYQAVATEAKNFLLTEIILMVDNDYFKLSDHDRTLLLIDKEVQFYNKHGWWLSKENYSPIPE